MSRQGLVNLAQEDMHDWHVRVLWNRMAEGRRVHRLRHGSFRAFENDLSPSNTDSV